MSVDTDDEALDNFRPFPMATRKAFPRKKCKQLKPVRSRQSRLDPSDLAINRKPFNVRLSAEGWRLADGLKAYYGVSGAGLVELLLREHSRTIKRKEEPLVGREALLDLLARASGPSAEENQ